MDWNSSYSVKGSVGRNATVWFLYLLLKTTLSYHGAKLLPTLLKSHFKFSALRSNIETCSEFGEYF
jgi:hypothetical protein